MSISNINTFRQLQGTNRKKSHVQKNLIWKLCIFFPITHVCMNFSWRPFNMHGIEKNPPNTCIFYCHFHKLFEIPLNWEACRNKEHSHKLHAGRWNGNKVGIIKLKVYYLQPEISLWGICSREIKTCIHKRTVQQFSQHLHSQ